MPPTPRLENQPTSTNENASPGSSPAAPGGLLGRLTSSLRGMSFLDGQRLLSPTGQAAPVGQNAPVVKEEKPDDPETKLGRALWAAYPAGVPVAIYDPAEPELVRQGEAWAKAQGAVGSKGKGFGPSQLAIGLAIPANEGLGAIVAALGPSLRTLADKGRPEGAKPGTGPALIRSLAIFSHGASGWLGMSGNTSKDDLGESGAAKVIGDMAGWLTADVNVILYACSVARGASEQESWVDGTTKGGGADSLSGVIRDALVDAGKDEATVFGHTTVGHTTRNFALREFKASDGKGSAGVSFIEEHVWDWQNLAPPLVFAEIAALGHAVPDAKRAKVQGTILSKVKSAIYKSYAGVMQSEKLDGQDLPAIAPVKPVEVGKIVRDKWLAAFDGGFKTKIAKAVIKAYGLKKL